MVSGNHDDPAVISGSPVPERMSGVVLISDISYISGKDKHFSGNSQRVVLQKTAVLPKLEMQVGAYWILIVVL